jgi:hypothetical protein
MIDSLTVPLIQFDLEGFIEAYRRFYRAWAGDEFDPAFSVPVLQRHGDTPMVLLEDRDLLGELLDQGWLLFFAMHEPLAAQTALCIDGVRRACAEFDIGVSDSYGFLVEVEDYLISLHPALYDHSSREVPTLDLQGRCSVLDGCMDRFVRGFIQGKLEQD